MRKYLDGLVQCDIESLRFVSDDANSRCIAKSLHIDAIDVEGWRKPAVKK